MSGDALIRAQNASARAWDLLAREAAVEALATGVIGILDLLVDQERARDADTGATQTREYLVWVGDQVMLSSVDVEQATDVAREHALEDPSLDVRITQRMVRHYPEEPVKDWQVEFEN